MAILILDARGEIVCLYTVPVQHWNSMHGHQRAQVTALYSTAGSHYYRPYGSTCSSVPYSFYSVVQLVDTIINI